MLTVDRRAVRPCRGPSRCAGLAPPLPRFAWPTYWVLPGPKALGFRGGFRGLGCGGLGCSSRALSVLDLHGVQAVQGAGFPRAQDFWGFGCWRSGASDSLESS